MSDTLPIFDLRTHRGTLDFPDQVNAYLSKELKLCRIAGPFDTVPLAQGFVVSPLNTVVKLACVAGWIRERASGGGAAILLGSLSTRTFEGDAAVIERLRLGRGLLRMTYPGLPTLCCRRRQLIWRRSESRE